MAGAAGMGGSLSTRVVRLTVSPDVTCASNRSPSLPITNSRQSRSRAGTDPVRDALTPRGSLHPLRDAPPLFVHPSRSESGAVLAAPDGSGFARSTVFGGARSNTSIRCRCCQGSYGGQGSDEEEGSGSKKCGDDAGRGRDFPGTTRVERDTSEASSSSSNSSGGDGGGGDAARVDGAMAVSNGAECAGISTSAGPISIDALGIEGSSRGNVGRKRGSARSRARKERANTTHTATATTATTASSLDRLGGKPAALHAARLVRSHGLTALSGDALLSPPAENGERGADARGGAGGTGNGGAGAVGVGAGAGAGPAGGEGSGAEAVGEREWRAAVGDCLQWTESDGEGLLSSARSSSSSSVGVGGSGSSGSSNEGVDESLNESVRRLSTRFPALLPRYVTLRTAVQPWSDLFFRRHNRRPTVSAM
ncbi:hypothetical protein CLOM_g5185 [Closterium sp. NIES-68]|nr:hypothetical protein CLOM_g5185 [Closterium sp. NIES-68]